MEKELIYLIGEKLMIGELDDVVRVTYPEETPTQYCIVELENGTKLKVAILD